MFSKITKRIIKKIAFSFISKHPTHLFKFQGGEGMSFLFKSGSDALLIELTKKWIGYHAIVYKINSSSGYKRILLINHIDERDSLILKDVLCNPRDNIDFKCYLADKFKNRLGKIDI